MSGLSYFAIQSWFLKSQSKPNHSPKYFSNVKSKSKWSPKYLKNATFSQQNASFLFHKLSPNPVRIFEVIYSPNPIQCYRTDPVQSKSSPMLSSGGDHARTDMGGLWFFVSGSNSVFIFSIQIRSGSGPTWHKQCDYCLIPRKYKSSKQPVTFFQQTQNLNPIRLCYSKNLIPDPVGGRVARLLDILQGHFIILRLLKFYFMPTLNTF